MVYIILLSKINKSKFTVKLDQLIRLMDVVVDVVLKNKTFIDILPYLHNERLLRR